MTLEAVQSLTHQVNQLSAECQAANPDGKAWQHHFLRIQHCFQTQVLPLADQVAVPETIQPILTEMNRTLRLLGMDMAFLQTARNTATRQQRQRHIVDQLQRLQAYCEALATALMA
jgi:hypothetical protein